MFLNSKQLTDSELLTYYRKGQGWAFREIINRYKNPLYVFLRRIINRHKVVEDAFQETFLELYTNQDSFDVNRPLQPWLFIVAANKAKHAFRKTQRQSCERETICF